MSKSKFSHCKVRAIAVSVPEHFINIDDEIKYYNNNKKLLERNKKILGLGKRHIADERTDVVDLCKDAAISISKEGSVDLKTVDTIIFASTTHLYHAPASSCILHGELDLSEECNCFDISGVSCSGYVYALWAAHALIESKASKRILLLAGDIVSLKTNPANRNTAMLYSDAGSATILEYTEEETPSYFDLGTQGKYYDKIIAPSTGFKLAVRDDIAQKSITDLNGNIWHFWEDILEGMDVFKYTMETGPKSVKELLNFSNKTMDDIDFFAIHQANGQIVNTVASHAKLPKEKYSAQTFKNYANSGITSVVSNLCDSLHNKNVKNAMLISFGVGLSFASAILDLRNSKILKIKEYKSDSASMGRSELISYWENLVKNK